MTDDPIRSRLRASMQALSVQLDDGQITAASFEIDSCRDQFRTLLWIVRGTDLDPWIENQREFPTITFWKISELPEVPFPPEKASPSGPPAGLVCPQCDFFAEVPEGASNVYCPRCGAGVKVDG